MTQLIGSVKRFELLAANSRFLIQNLLYKILYYTDVKESPIFVAEIVEKN